MNIVYLVFLVSLLAQVVTGHLCVLRTGVVFALHSIWARSVDEAIMFSLLFVPELCRIFLGRD